MAKKTPALLFPQYFNARIMKYVEPKNAYVASAKCCSHENLLIFLSLGKHDGKHAWIVSSSTCSRGDKYFRLMMLVSECGKRYFHSPKKPDESVYVFLAWKRANYINTNILWLNEPICRRTKCTHPVNRMWHKWLLSGICRCCRCRTTDKVSTLVSCKLNKFYIITTYIFFVSIKYIRKLLQISKYRTPVHTNTHTHTKSTATKMKNHISVAPFYGDAPKTYHSIKHLFMFWGFSVFTYTSFVSFEAKFSPLFRKSYTHTYTCLLQFNNNIEY